MGKTNFEVKLPVPASDQVPYRVIEVQVRTNARIGTNDPRVRKYPVEAHRLTATSEHLAQAVRDLTTDQIIRIVWPDQIEFHMYLLWLEGSDLQTKDAMRRTFTYEKATKRQTKNKSDHESLEEGHFVTLLQLWKLGCFLKDSTFCNIVVDTLIKIVMRCDSDPYNLFEVLTPEVVNPIWTAVPEIKRHAVTLHMQTSLVTIIATFAGNTVLQYFSCSPEYCGPFKAALRTSMSHTLPIHAVPRHWPPPEQYAKGLRAEVVIEDTRIQRIFPSAKAWERVNTTAKEDARLRANKAGEDRLANATNVLPGSQLTGAQWQELAYWTVMKSTHSNAEANERQLD